MAAKVFESIGKFGLALAVAGGVVNSALYNVDAGHRAVIFDRFRGVQDIVVGEGTHFLIPWVQKPIIFDCRSRPRNVPVITGSKDLQNVNITLRILFRPVASQLPRIFTSIGEDYDERVLPSITTEILKPNRWPSRKRRGPDLWWKRLSNRRRQPSSLLRAIPKPPS
uniref:Prohibitin n=1 Tax=Molossus molossus TaxID=27622 RepID=A0A7J8D1D2_MOLMO|nr:prohibitin [Molossus molossus]